MLREKLCLMLQRVNHQTIRSHDQLNYISLAWTRPSNQSATIVDSHNLLLSPCSPVLAVICQALAQLKSHEIRHLFQCDIHKERIHEHPIKQLRSKIFSLQGTHSLKSCVASAATWKKSLIYSYCLFGAEAFPCWQNSDRNSIQRLSSRSSCPWITISVLMRSYTMRKQNWARARVWFESIGVDWNKGQSSIDPSPWWLMAASSIWVQPCEDGRGREVRWCHCI